MSKKVFIFGIDGAPPELIFEEWIEDLPNIKKLVSRGIHGTIKSTLPPATLIAWNSMLSGKDAGQLGVYSYTKRIKEDGAYKSVLIDSSEVKCERIWETLDKKGMRSIVLNVPLTYPVKPINGVIIGGFLTPGLNEKAIYPNNIKQLIEKHSNPNTYFDVAGFLGYKGLDIESLIDKTYQMTDSQFAVLDELMEKEEWDFLVNVTIGSDRLQHLIWHHFDSTHPNFIRNSPYRFAIKDYYIYLDKKIGEIFNKLGKDTLFIVISDHGFGKQLGRINLNDWLIKKRYLILKEKYRNIDKPKKLKMEMIDFSKTKAYEVGAHHGRIYINSKERGGIVDEKEYPELLEEISRKIKIIRDNKNKKINTKIYTREEAYPNGFTEDAPDLIILFDNLAWGVNPDIGNNGLYSWETTVGKDFAGHYMNGIYIIVEKKKKKKKKKNINILDIHPTILKYLGINQYNQKL